MINTIKYFGLLFLFVGLFTACESGDGSETITTDSGLVIDITEKGEGAEVAAGQTVTVHYTGTLEDGTKFDSSVDRGVPFSFPLGQGRVIKGWDEGIPYFNVGGKGKLTIPGDLAYGARGAAGGKIPPNATLVFDIEVVDVK